MHNTHTCLYFPELIPGVCLGSRATWTGKELVELFENFRRHRDLQRLERAIELLTGSRPRHRGGDTRLCEQPGQRHISWLLPQFATEALVFL